MDNFNLKFSACLGCHFVPFCSSECNHGGNGKQLTSSVKRLLRLKRKEVLYLPKHKFQNFYAIQKGALKTYQMEANGKELIRAFYFAGEILGYKAIATGHYLFSATALTDTVICEIPYDEFLKQVHAEPELLKLSFHLISKQLNSGAYLAASTAEQRLAAFLIDLSRRLRPAANSDVYHLPLSRQDMGNYLRLTAETISRLLSKLQKARVIAVTQKRLQILEPEKLELFAEGLV